MKKKSRTPVRMSRRPAPMLDFVIDYKNYEKLGRYLTDRAKVLGRKRSGLSAKQQKRMTRALKQARHLGLLPFVARV